MSKEKGLFNDTLSQFEKAHSEFGHMDLLFDDKQKELYREMLALFEVNGKDSMEAIEKVDEFCLRLVEQVKAQII